jgi:hypothetical protein
MKTPFLFALILCVAIASLGAQPHNNGYILPGASGQVHAVTMKGAVTSAQRASGSIYCTTMNVDNATVLVYDSSNNGIFKIDPLTLAVVGTFYTNSSMTSTTNVYDMCFDQNGDLYFGSSSSSGIGRGVFKIDQTSTLTPVTMASSSSQPFYYPENLEIDIDSAEVLIADDRSGDPLVLLERDGTSFTTIATGWNFRYGTHKDMNTGAIFSGTCCNTSGTRSIYWLKPATTTPVTFVSSSALRGGYDPMLDRASMANPRIVCSAWNSSNSGGLFYVDVNSQAVSKLTTIARNTYDVTFVYGRNLQSARTGKGTWDIHLNAPGHGGKAYVVAVSAAGTRPGIALPDGRRVPLAFDTLSYLSLLGSLSPFLSNNIGTLDKSGTALAKLDLSTLPSGANDTLLWIGAVVLDSSAPLGMALIVDTKVLKIEGL